jgi:hypothetical protein
VIDDSFLDFRIDGVVRRPDVGRQARVSTTTREP